MSEEIFRPAPKRLILEKSRLIIHPEAEDAYRVWHEFHIQKPHFNHQIFTGYYQVLPKLILGKIKEQYLFFENFEYMYYVASLNKPTSISSLIIPESQKNIELCAWAQVLQIPFQNQINPAEFFNVLKRVAPLSVLQKLMNIKRFDKTQFLKYYELHKDTFGYYQSKIRDNHRKQLPKMSEWMKKS